MSGIDIVLIVLIAAAVAGAVIIMIRMKKQGRSFSCGGDCTRCSQSCRNRKKP